MSSKTVEPPSVPVEPEPTPFLDVQALMELSRPQPRGNWFGLMALGCVALFTYSAVAGLGSHDRWPGQAAVLTLLVLLTPLAIGGFVLSVRRYRRQLQAVEGIEELVQLRRWEPAAMLLDRCLSTPVRSPRVWARALVQLAAVLTRYHRFADAVSVADFLAEHDVLLDEPAAYGIREMRAMALLREDRLLDADRAISDLRRRGPARESGPLALVEIYRDVKTGHPAEAIEVFAARQGVLRTHLGHRAADAHALVARAFDLLGRGAEAAAAYGRATLLAPAAELHRRYPELAPLAGKYPPAPAPQEVA